MKKSRNGTLLAAGIMAIILLIIYIIGIANFALYSTAEGYQSLLELLNSGNIRIDNLPISNEDKAAILQGTAMALTIVCAVEAVLAVLRAILSFIGFAKDSKGVNISNLIFSIPALSILGFIGSIIGLRRCKRSSEPLSTQDDLDNDNSHVIVASQNNKMTSNQAKEVNQSKTSKFDEIKEYKNLLDEGIITNEEFENKKKELL